MIVNKMLTYQLQIVNEDMSKVLYSMGKKREGKLKKPERGIDYEDDNEININR